jgi:hypothetical protein
MNKLQSERMAVGLQLQEPWLREYQVFFFYGSNGTFEIV